MDKSIQTVMKKLMEERYSTRIFEQLIRINGEAKSVEEPIGCDISLTDYCPFIKKEYSKKEIQTLKNLLSETIVVQLQKDNTYLQTARLVAALECLEDTKKLPKDSNKVKFVRKFLSSSECYYNNLSPALKDITLLDNI